MERRFNVLGRKIKAKVFVVVGYILYPNINIYTRGDKTRVTMPITLYIYIFVCIFTCERACYANI